MADEIPTHPVQTANRIADRQGKEGRAPQVVTLRAYEVYEHVHGPQPAMITGNCRSGFSTGELIAFLYAHSFPKEQWRDRCDEAFRGAENL